MPLTNDDSSTFDPVKNYDSVSQAQYNFPAGFVRTTDEPRQLFYDPFDAALDTTNRWNAGVVSGATATVATVALGNLTLGSGTTASGYSHLSSIPTFTPTVPGWLGESHALKIEFPVLLNSYRFWGHATIPGSPTTAAPITEGFGFEIDTAGKLFAVVYAAGVKTFSTDLSSATGSSKQPADANMHRYIVYYRTDKIFFYIDGLITPVATADFFSPNVQSLPHRFLAVAGATPPTSNAVITVSGLAVWDTAKNNTTLSDGTFGFRKATIKAASTAAVATDTPLVITVHPTTAAQPVTAPTITKGTQGANGFTVQNLKDAGRNQTNYHMTLPVITTAVDALASLTGYKASAAVAATTTPAVVTTGKTYRINTISITYVAIATAGTVKFSLRAQVGGVVTITSPIVVAWVLGAAAATAGVSQTYDLVLPDGLEFPAGTGIGVSMVGLSALQVAAAAGYGQISIQGYEY